MDLLLTSLTSNFPRQALKWNKNIFMNFKSSDNGTSVGVGVGGWVL